MNTSATLQHSIQIRPSRLAALVVAVATLSGVVTWSVSNATNESHSTSPKSDVVSNEYVREVQALSPEQQAAIYGNVSPSQQHARAVSSLSPEQQAAIYGNVSPGQQHARAVSSLGPEQQAAIYGNVSPSQTYADRVAALSPAELAAVFGNVSSTP